MKRIAVLTSGGDAPGMNAAIRAVTRAALARGMTVDGVRDGFAGLAAGTFVALGVRDVGGIIQRAGTMLGSARFPELRERAVQERAIAALRARAVDGLVIIGGNGSQTGGAALAAHGFPVLGIASTIDNDLVGSDITIGVDTALHVAVEAIDRLRATAASHRRCAIVEVMGRDSGHLALMSAVAGGAEAVLLPERPRPLEEIVAEIAAAHRRGKSHALVVVAEGASPDAAGLAAYLRAHHEGFAYEMRVTILGHVQRGGTPTPADRLLASRLGVAAVDHLARGVSGVVLGVVAGAVHATPFADVVGRLKPLDVELLATAEMLSR
jgi:6-phosphofructokinase 1